MILHMFRLTYTLNICSKIPGGAEHVTEWEIKLTILGVIKCDGFVIKWIFAGGLSIINFVI